VGLEVPAAHILVSPTRAGEDIPHKGHLAYKDEVDKKWAELAYNAVWFNPSSRGLKPPRRRCQRTSRRGHL
jgi:argininosuccinate synthase